MADAGDYQGVEFVALIFEEIDWSEIGEHDPGRRSQWKHPNETDVHVEWATEACQDPRRWVRSAGSRSGRTVKVTGRSTAAGFLITVVLAAKDHPPRRRWWGASAWKAKASEQAEYEEGLG